MNSARVIGKELGGPQVSISPSALTTICDFDAAKEESLQQVITKTLKVAIFERKEPKGDVIYFSVNIGHKGIVKLLRLQATKENVRGKSVFVIKLSREDHRLSH